MSSRIVDLFVLFKVMFLIHMDKGVLYSIRVTQSISSNTNRIYGQMSWKHIQDFARPTSSEEESKCFQVEQGSTIILKTKCCKRKTSKKQIKGKQHCQSIGLRCPTCVFRIFQKINYVCYDICYVGSEQFDTLICMFFGISVIRSKNDTLFYNIVF